MDLKHFKKVHEAEDHSVLKHPDGHEIKVLHGKLKKNEISQLKALPMLADGTPDGDVADTVEQAPQAPPVPQAAPQQASNLPVDYSKELKSALSEQKAGMAEEAAAKQQEAHALYNKQETPEGITEIGVLPEALRDISSTGQQRLNAADKIMQERQAAIEDYKKGYITDNHFFENQSVPQKIVTAIGLIAGGIGGQGNGNPALDFMNRTIERNVTARKDVINALQQQFGDQQSAADMARIMNHDILDLKLRQAEAQAADPLAKARLQQARGQLNAQFVPTLANLQYRQQVIQGMQQGQLPPEAGVQVMVDPAQQPKVYESLGKVRQLNALQSDVERSAQALNQKLLHGALSPNETEAQVMTFAGPLQKIFEGRYNKEGAEQQMRNLMPAKTDGPGTAKVKADLRKQFFEAGRQEHYPILMGNHIPVPKPAAQATPRSYRAGSNQ